MSFVIAIALALVTGLATAAQGPTNAALGKATNAAQASLVSMGGGMIILTATCLVMGFSGFDQVLLAEPWMYLGGIYAVFIVFSMAYCTPHLGAALCLTLVMLGQLSGGMVIDGFGLLGVAKTDVSVFRIAGCLSVLMGIAFVYVGQRRQEGSGHSGVADTFATVFCMILSFLAGAASAIQTPTNAALSQIIGTLKASTMSFWVGFSVLLAICLVISRGRLASMKGLAAWKFTGGVYGAIGVPCLTAATPVLGVSLALCCLMLAQLIGALVVDAAGWFEVKKIKVDGVRIFGAVLLAAGVVLVSFARM